MPSQLHTRRAAVAGLFYPAAREELAATVADLLDDAAGGSGLSSDGLPKALIAPHAGYVYSGPVAARAFVSLGERAGECIRRVVIVGPSHYVPFAGIARSGARGFETPLGLVAVDREAEGSLDRLPQVTTLPAAHAREHALEVELPFLQVLLRDFRIVPLVVGEADARDVGEALERLWGGAETLIVVSSDLSHYLDYRSARLRDRETCRAIEQLRRTDLRPEEACGCRAINGLVWLARRRGLSARTLDLRNSGDTAGPRGEVVGYGAWALR